MRIAFRTDASNDLGLGHVMRCLTLAQGWQAKGASSHFLCANLPASLGGWIESQGHMVHAFDAPSHATEMEDAATCLPYLEALRPHWLVVDHYQLGRAWENAVAHCVGKVMVIDDLANRPHQAELLLDQTLNRTAESYRPLTPDTTRFCLGSSYALLRPAFAARRAASQAFRKNAGFRLNKIIVSLGGTDPGNLSAQVLQALAADDLRPLFDVTVALSAQAPHAEFLRTLINELGLKARLLLGETDLSTHFSEADLAIGAAGSSAWERCCLGLPSLMLITADNQKDVAAALEKAGAARLIPSDGTLQQHLRIALLDLARNPAKLAQLSDSAAQQIDGLGLDRTLVAMDETLKMPPPDKGRLRPMIEEDLATVLAWRNHPDIRSRMRDQDPISPQAHHKWFANKQTSSRHSMLIYEELAQPRGFVQFAENQAGIAEWGFYAAPEAPPGTGYRLCQQALDKAFVELGFNRIEAEVLAGNHRSLRLHHRLGFRSHSTPQPEADTDGHLSFPMSENLVLDVATWSAERNKQ